MKILDTKAWVASLACSALAGGAPAPLIRLTPDLAPGLLLCVLLGLLASWGSGPFPAFLVGLCRAWEGGQGQTPALRARPRAEGGRSPCARPVLCSQGRCCVVPDPTRIPPGSRQDPATPSASAQLSGHRVWCVRWGDARCGLPVCHRAGIRRGCFPAAQRAI